jgi:sulfite reductase (NADPH) hemoprotein beta-component
MTDGKNQRLAAEETLKINSRYLRGTLTESLADPVTGAIPEDDAKLLKFHGVYLQDDRDVRQERLRRKLEPAHGYLIRVRMPGGVCTPAQWLRLDDLAVRYGFPSLRITTRQTFQFHGVPKRHLKTVIAGINAALLDTIAACGDVNRNVVCHNNPYLSPLHAELHAWARRLSDDFLPRTRAYHEIWLDGQPLDPTGPGDDEPLYGKTYLPRKFKIGIALPPGNDIDVLAQDLGYIAIAEGGTLHGFNVAVGGGMGTTHGDTATYPRLASVIGFCPPDRLIEVTRHVLGIQRDFGDRGNRKHARFKYTLDDRGLDWFRAELERRLDEPLAEARPFEFHDNADPLGWHQDDQGLWHLTLAVPSGRLRDTGDVAWLTALREIARLHTGDFRLTANQNLTISRVTPGLQPDIEKLLDHHRIPRPESWSALRQRAISCVAFPTCGLAMAESERWLPRLLTRLETVLRETGLEQAPINLRVTGCPNGCGRPFLGEIGLVGKAPGRYNLYLGAALNGSRLNRLYREAVTEDDVVGELTPILRDYAKRREPGETFGDFVIRLGYSAPVREGRDFHAPS